METREDQRQPWPTHRERPSRTSDRHPRAQGSPQARHLRRARGDRRGAPDLLGHPVVALRTRSPGDRRCARRRRPVAITSKIPERINQILVDTNQQVHKGQLLVVFDDKDERARSAAAQAQYDLAVANQRTNTLQNQGGVTQASGNIADAPSAGSRRASGVAQADAQVRSAQALLPAAQAALQKAQADYSRTLSLVATGDVPAQQLDAIRSEQAAASRNFQRRADQINVAQANYDAAQRARGGASRRPGGARRRDHRARQTRPSQRSEPSRVGQSATRLRSRISRTRTSIRRSTVSSARRTPRSVSRSPPA